MANRRINGVNFLEYLSVDAVLNIVSRIKDANMLCNCTLVSKLFASFIYRIRSVSLRLPEVDANSVELYSNFLKDTGDDELYFNDDEYTWHINPSSARKIAKIIAFLRNFRELESIEIEAPCPRSPCTSPFLKWKGKLNSREPVVTGLVAINWTAMHMLAEGEEPVEEGEEEEEEETTNSTQDTSQDASLYPIISCTEWLSLVFSVVRSHDSLQRVTCSDAHRHGEFVIEAEQIGEWRRQMIRQNEHPRELYPGKMGNGRWHELLLPESRYVLKRVSFMLMVIPVDGELDEDVHFEDMLNWEYSDDEAVFQEAVKEIIRFMTIDEETD